MPQFQTIQIKCDFSLDKDLKFIIIGFYTTFDDDETTPSNEHQRNIEDHKDAADD